MADEAHLVTHVIPAWRDTTTGYLVKPSQVLSVAADVLEQLNEARKGKPDADAMLTGAMSQVIDFLRLIGSSGKARSAIAGGPQA